MELSKAQEKIRDEHVRTSRGKTRDKLVKLLGREPEEHEVINATKDPNLLLQITLEELAETKMELANMKTDVEKAKKDVIKIQGDVKKLGPQKP